MKLEKLKPISQILTTRCFKTYLVEGPYCVTVVKPYAEVTLADAMENSQSVVEISETKIYPMLVDNRKIKSISKEARDFFSMRNRKGKVSAIAILVASPVSVIIGNFFMGLNKPTVPTKLFTEEGKAFKWLNQFLDK